jgi:hypothetical protein
MFTNLLEQTPGAEYTRLADVLFECARTHALGQWGFLGRRLCGTMGKQIIITS